MPLTNLQERLLYERTTGARLLMLWAAIFWAFSLAMPEVTLRRPAYHLMSELGADWGWVTVFVIYALLLTVPAGRSMWRWFITISVHMGGVILWGTVSACMLAANGIASAAVMPNAALAVASCWVLWNAPRCPRKVAP